jgi:hypothetical protein
MSRNDAAGDVDWPAERWLGIFSRIEHRQFHVGLRYWGPPVWLEVTMTGPDADAWPASSDDTLSWDWQSSAPCTEVEQLVAAGADDDVLLAAVGRYTIENVILNAVHEIGEWLRFDGRRVFSAHADDLGRSGEPGNQGNGRVSLQVAFAGPDELAATAALLPDEVGGRRLVKRLAPLAATRFTYLPGTSISFEAAGPVIRTWAVDETVRTWRSTWSGSTIEAARGGAEGVILLVMQDVHRALVTYEADRVCQAFHIDGSRPWRLAGSLDDDAPGAQTLAVALQYTQSAYNETVSSDEPYDDTEDIAVAIALFVDRG